MESPLKLELPKLSHLHLLQLLLPYIPGIVIALGVAMGTPSPVRTIEALGIGYKTTIGMIAVCAYLMGLAAVTVTGTVNSIVMCLMKKELPAMAWNNVYWRRVASTYVGNVLSPGNESFSSEDLLRLIGDFKPDAKAEFARHQTASKNLDTALSGLKESVARAVAAGNTSAKLLLDASSDEVRNALKLKQTLDDSFDSLRNLGKEVEWRTLYHAVACIPNDSQSPFESFTLLMSSLQCSGVCAIVLIMYFPILFNVAALSFSCFLLLSTTYALWYLHKYSVLTRSYSSTQIAGMIQELSRLSSVRAKE